MLKYLYEVWFLTQNCAMIKINFFNPDSNVINYIFSKLQYPLVNEFYITFFFYIHMSLVLTQKTFKIQITLNKQNM